MLATPLLYDIALVTSLSLRITVWWWWCVNGNKTKKQNKKTKKGSTLKYFYWLAVISATKSELT